MPLLSHVDLRVRDRNRARAFYDALLRALGASREDGATFTTYEVAPAGMSGDDAYADQWFGFTEDPAVRPSLTRVAFDAPSRGIVDDIARRLPAIGALSIEGPEEAYGPNYYAVFFTDPDGNPLEVCCITGPS